MSVDRYFQILVDGVDKNNTQTAITVAMNGVIITGILIGIQEYSDELKALFGVKKPFQVDVSNRETPEYFHLKDAHFISPGKYPYLEASLLWRGKLASVDGFTFGKLERVSGA